MICWKTITVNYVMSAFPPPWQFHWGENEPPQIVAANGRVVCTLPSGTIMSGPDEDCVIQGLAEAIMVSAQPCVHPTVLSAHEAVVTCPQCANNIVVEFAQPHSG